jgi:hypothetical protein
MEERLVRRTAHVYLAFSRVRLGVDQRHGVGPYRNNIECLVVRRKAETVHQQFGTRERTQRCRNIFAQMNRTEQFVCGKIDQRNRVRGLVSRADSVAGRGAYLAYRPEAA